MCKALRNTFRIGCNSAYITQRKKKKPQEPGASESEYGKAIFGGESGIRTHGAFPHHQFSRLAP